MSAEGGVSAEAARTTHKVALIIPTLNAERHCPELIPAILGQTLKPDRFIVIDSTSSDRTGAVFQEAGAEVVVIPRAEFDHGGTRQRAADLVPECEILLYLTQDAIPDEPTAFARLVAAFDDPKVAVAFGRQLPHRGAGLIEAHARHFNYPARGRCDRLADARTVGLRAAFCSNSFAAYRRSVLYELGGFPSEVVWGEDMILGARALMAGYAKAYVADAPVRHSHGYSLGQEFRRYFDAGSAQEMNGWLGETFGKAGGEGMRFLKSELAFVGRRAPWLLPSVIVRTAVKYAGFKAGGLHASFPSGWRPSMSMQPAFWRRRIKG